MDRKTKIHTIEQSEWKRTAGEEEEKRMRSRKVKTVSMLKMNNFVGDTSKNENRQRIQFGESEYTAT